MKNALLLATVGLSGWLVGSYFEKRKRISFSNFQNNDIVKRYPGIPIFGSLSAATVIDDNLESKIVQVQSRTSEIMKHGFPGLDEIRSFDDFVLSYDKRNRIAHWVFEHLTAERLKVKENVDRSKCDFREDKSIHPYFRSTNEDYLGSGYDRGHLAAAGNHKLHQRHCDQTFYLSNISPQVGVGFNRHSWNRLEKYVRKLTKSYPNVYVCTGPLFLPRKEADGKKYIKYEVIGSHDVAVPTHFFKVVVLETSDRKLLLEAYVMPNEPIDDNVPLSSFQVPPDSIERHAGLLFFDRISKSNLVSVNGRKTSYV
ncbi:endonuclease G, mitochondrial [Rhodnius prolixus]|uniref:Endonuclease n=1 Tax=Rhodnius prolixus TaxID=13249 RepID=R4FMW0_RHOPR